MKNPPTSPLSPRFWSLQMKKNAIWNIYCGEKFQSRLDQAIEVLEGVKKVADDILVIGNDANMIMTGNYAV